ncbi:ricin-type beta-trefoil lectin domain protein [Jatrophihabitans sp. DSM 45814]
MRARIRDPARAELRISAINWTDSASGAFTGPNVRTLTTTYTFKTDNQNIAGGEIPIYHTGTLALCMDAGSENPGAGALLTVQACTSPKTSQQLFAYNSDLSLQLVASSPPMCLDAGALPHILGTNVVFQPCTTPANARQQWSIDDSSNFQGATTSGTLDGSCFKIQNSNTVGSPVVLATCSGNFDINQTWVPEPAVGAGAAGLPLNGNSPPQLVNFQQFGRCLDVTNQTPDATTSGEPGGGNYLIAYPCKQAPNPAKVLWNQKFSVNSTGEIVTVYTNNNNYCLQSPGNSLTGSYVRTVACPTGTPPTNLVWTYNGTADSSGKELPYSKKYTIVDSSSPSLCLSLSANSDQYKGAYNKTVVAPCDGSLLQKWNADPNIQIPNLQNTGEK